MKIDDQVLDRDGALWTVLNPPDGSGVCDGLFRRESEPRPGRQQYSENMRHPLVLLPQATSAQDDDYEQRRDRG